jgi:hypothetical protein
MANQPWIKLDLNAQGLTATWGPEVGEFGIFSADDIQVPKTVTIKKWWLFIGAIAHPEGPGGSNQKFEELPNSEIFNKSVGIDRMMTIPLKDLPPKKLILAQVIGLFDSKTPDGEPLLNKKGEPVVEGIYSNVERVVIKPVTST